MQIFDMNLPMEAGAGATAGLGGGLFASAGSSSAAPAVPFAAHLAATTTVAAPDGGSSFQGGITVAPGDLVQQILNQIAEVTTATGGKSVAPTAQGDVAPQAGAAQPSEVGAGLGAPPLAPGAEGAVSVLSNDAMALALAAGLDIEGAAEASADSPLAGGTVPLVPVMFPDESVPPVEAEPAQGVPGVATDAEAADTDALAADSGAVAVAQAVTAQLAAVPVLPLTSPETDGDVIAPAATDESGDLPGFFPPVAGAAANAGGEADAPPAAGGNTAAAPAAEKPGAAAGAPATAEAAPASAASALGSGPAVLPGSGPDANTSNGALPIAGPAQAGGEASVAAAEGEAESASAVVSASAVGFDADGSEGIAAKQAGDAPKAQVASPARAAETAPNAAAGVAASVADVAADTVPADGVETVAAADSGRPERPAVAPTAAAGPASSASGADAQLAAQASRANGQGGVKSNLLNSEQDALAGDADATTDEAASDGATGLRRTAETAQAQQGAEAAQRQRPAAGNGPALAAAPATLAMAAEAIDSINFDGGDSFDPSLGAARGQGGATPSGAAASASSQSQTLPMALMSMEIARNAQRGVNRFTIRLDPPELGRVDVRLKIGDDGQVRAHLIVERPETLDLLQRDQRGMERALENAGLKTASDSGLQFSLKDQGGQSFAGSGEDQPARHGFASAPEGAETPVDQQAALERVAAYARNAAGGVDIRV